MYTDLSVTAMSCSSCVAFSPAVELKADLVPSAERRSPPACQSIASQRQVVSSEPSATYAHPYCLCALSVSFCAADRKSSHVQLAVGNATPAAWNSFLLYTSARLSTSAGTP